MKKILEIPIHKKFNNEKDTYKYLKDNVFEEALKLYTPILRGFPDFIVVSYRYPYNILKPSFVEVKFNKGRLSVYQEKFLQWLAKGFAVYVFHIETQNNESVLRIYEWD